MDHQSNTDSLRLPRVERQTNHDCRLRVSRTGKIIHERQSGIILQTVVCFLNLLQLAFVLFKLFSLKKKKKKQPVIKPDT